MVNIDSEKSEEGESEQGSALGRGGEPNNLLDFISDLLCGVFGFKK